MNRALSLLRGKAPKPLLPFLLAATVFLYLHLFIPPFAPIWIGGDQTVYLLNATRMLQGDVIYRDFFQFTLPGTELVYFGLFRLFGTWQWVPNTALILLGLTLTWLIVTISKQLLKGQRAFLPGLLFLTMPYRNMLNGTHHWFSAAAVMGAMAVVTGKRTLRRLAGAGMLCGVATFFTQTRGVAAVLGFAAFLVLEWRSRKLSVSLLKGGGSLIGGFLATVVATNVYFAVKAGSGAFWNSTVTFVLRYYPAGREANTWRAYMSGLPNASSWSHVPTLCVFLFIHGLLPLVYVIFLIRYRRQVSIQPEELRARLTLLNTVGLFLFLGVMPAPNFFRLFSSSAPALILFVWLLSSVRPLHKVLLNFFWILGITLALTEPWPLHVRSHCFLDLRTGRTAFLSAEQCSKYKWLLDHTRRSEFFFDASLLPGLYFPLGLRNPAKVPDLTTTDYTRPEQVQDAVGALDDGRVRLVYWSVSMDLQEDPSSSGHLGPLRAYLHAHYHVIKTFADGDQVWERTSPDIRGNGNSRGSTRCEQVRVSIAANGSRSARQRGTKH